MLLSSCGADGLGDDDLDDMIWRVGLALVAPGDPDGPGYHLRRRLGGAFSQVGVDGPGQAGDGDDQAGQRDRVDVLRRRGRGLPALEACWQKVTGGPLPSAVRDYVHSHDPDAGDTPEGAGQ